MKQGRAHADERKVDEKQICCLLKTNYVVR